MCLIKYFEYTAIIGVINIIVINRASVILAAFIFTPICKIRGLFKIRDVMEQSLKQRGFCF